MGEKGKTRCGQKLEYSFCSSQKHGKQRKNMWKRKNKMCADASGGNSKSVDA
jgi:hypothetical protein